MKSNNYCNIYGGVETGWLDHFQLSLSDVRDQEICAMRANCLKWIIESTDAISDRMLESNHSYLKNIQQCNVLIRFHHCDNNLKSVRVCAYYCGLQEDTNANKILSQVPLDGQISLRHHTIKETDSWARMTQTESGSVRINAQKLLL